MNWAFRPFVWKAPQCTGGHQKYLSWQWGEQGIAMMTMKIGNWWWSWSSRGGAANHFDGWWTVLVLAGGEPCSWAGPPPRSAKLLSINGEKNEFLCLDQFTLQTYCCWSNDRLTDFQRGQRASSEQCKYWDMCVRNFPYVSVSSGMLIVRSKSRSSLVT